MSDQPLDTTSPDYDAQARWNFKHGCDKTAGAAFGDLLGLHGTVFRKTALRRCGGNQVDADDAFQDFCVDSLNGRKTYELSKPWAPWACRILVNSVAKLQRRRSQRSRMLVTVGQIVLGGHDSPVVPEGRVEELLSLREFSTHLDKSLDKLEAKDRELVIAHVLWNTTFRKLAEHSGGTLSNTFERYNTAIERLAEMLKRLGYGP